MGLLFKCRFRLPFKLPVEENTAIVSSRFFGDFKAVFETDKEIVKTEDNEIENIYTVMNITLSPNDPQLEKIEADNLLRVCVINSLNYINHFLDAFRSASQLSYVKNITIVDLPMAMSVSIDEDLYLYVTGSPELIGQDHILDNEIFIKTLNLMSTWDRHPEIAIQERFLESAKTLILREQFSSAIIELETSFEVFIRNTHRLILIKNETSEEEVIKLTKIPFRNVIEQHLSRHLKEDFSFSKEGPIRDWYENLYTKRNDIVHRGHYHVSLNEANLALEAYIKARNYISDCLQREGYLTENGMIDLSVFSKNAFSVDYSEITNKLKEKGFLPKDKEVEER
jgi:hypothetical protein